MTNLTEYVVIESNKLVGASNDLEKDMFTTSELITAGGRLIMARNADEAEEVYVAEHGGSINDLVAFVAWREQE